MRKFLKTQKPNILFCLLSLVVMAVGWIVVYRLEGNDLIVPPLGKTLKSFFSLFGQASFWSSLGNTLLRVLCAVAVSFAIATVVTALTLLYPPFKGFFAPVVAVCRTVPTMAVVLIFMLAFSRYVTPVIVTVLVLLPMFCAQLSTAVGGVDKGLLQMAKVYGVSRRQTLVKIYLPQTLPPIVGQLGTAFSFGIKLTISAEVLAYTYNGLGGLMKTANYWLEISRLSALTLVAVLVGLLFELFFYLLCKNLFKWRGV